MLKPQRLQKILAQSGLGSRRVMEDWISQGKVKVNGQVARIGQSVCANDVVQVNGRRVPLKLIDKEQARLIMYHKPEGEICSRAKDCTNSVFDKLPRLIHGKWISVGRLDVNSAGLLLFTNDGELAHRLMHPQFDVERKYAVRVIGRINEQTLARLTQGIQLEDGIYRLKDITPLPSQGVNQWFLVSLMQGKYREIRRLFESQNCTVNRLIRIQYGEFSLPRSLRKGQWQELNPGAL